eukprot:COSAG01_NODE_50886_length_359_cov_1.146154_1_plen_26_part_01
MVTRPTSTKTTLKPSDKVSYVQKPLV